MFSLFMFVCLSVYCLLGLLFVFCCGVCVVRFMLKQMCVLLCVCFFVVLNMVSSVLYAVVLFDIRVVFCQIVCSCVCVLWVFL